MWEMQSMEQNPGAGVLACAKEAGVKEDPGRSGDPCVFGSCIVKNLAAPEA